MKWYEMTNVAHDTGEIMIYDQVGSDEVNAKTFNDDLKSLGAVQVLNLHINSPGGSVFDGFAIYNQLKRHQATVNVFIDGVAASIASVIAMAGDHIVMPSNTFQMIHNPAGLVWGTAKEMQKFAGTLDQIKEGLITAYQDKTGLPRARINTLMDEETWFTAAEAVELGFADEQIQEVKMAAHFDLSAYQNIPAMLSSMAFDKNSHTNAATSTEQSAKQAWQNDPELRAEFNDNQVSYLAYMKAASEGRARIFSPRKKPY